jgi:hypothetical protein
MIKPLSFLLLISVFFSCKTVTLKKRTYPELYNADSAVLMYYTRPGDPRFYKMVKLYDTITFRPLADDVNGIITDSVTGCITQGKFYFYEGRNAVHTIYFSRERPCRSLYFIKTGKKYFTGMSDAVKQWLDKMEPLAAEPKSAM